MKKLVNRLQILSVGASILLGTATAYRAISAEGDGPVLPTPTSKPTPTPTSKPTPTPTSKPTPTPTSTEASTADIKSAESALSADESKPATWKYDHEQEWIVDSIGRDVVEMILFAKYHASAPEKLTPEEIEYLTSTIDRTAGKYKQQLVLQEPNEVFTRELTLQDYAWSPQEYAPLATELIAKLQLTADAASAVPADFLKRMADCTMESLFQESKRISNGLNQHPLDPSLHEQAALLQAAFDLRECAGAFSDTRPPLARISAHLSIARALQPEPSIVAKLAEIALESMSCRDGIAVKKIIAMESAQTDPIVKSWMRAIKIRSSGNYRLFDAKNHTPLEETQYGLRYAYYTNADSIVEYVGNHNPQPAICWLRLGMIGYSSVASGHMFEDHALSAELDDFYKDYKIYKGQTFSDLNSLKTELNQTAKRCLQNSDGKVQLDVLSWSDVAAYHARHIMNGVRSQYRFKENSFADHEAARGFLKQATNMFSGVDLYPLFLSKIELKNDPRKDLFVAGSVPLLAEKPELVVSHYWSTCADALKAVAPAVVVPSGKRWFSPLVPMGTTYYFGERLYGFQGGETDLQALNRFRALNPYDEGINYTWATKKYGKNPTSANLEEAYGSMLEFDMVALQKTAEADYKHPEKYLAWQEKLAKFDPGHYTAIAAYCAQHNQADRAAKYFLKAFDVDHNRVRVANSSGWLVNYLYDHGQKEKAFLIAKYAGQVYSARGLSALGKLYERMGDLSNAEEQFLRIRDRYEDKKSLCAFYLRHASQNKRYAADAAKLMKDLFPAGMKRVTLASFKTPPKSGLKMTSCCLNAEEAGILENSIVVGVNGYLIEDGNQYAVIRELPLVDPAFKFIVWDGEKYKEVTLQGVGSPILGDFENYKAQ